MVPPALAPVDRFGRAMEMVLTARMVDAEEAYRIGLVASYSGKFNGRSQKNGQCYHFQISMAVNAPRSSQYSWVGLRGLAWSYPYLLVLQR